MKRRMDWKQLLAYITGSVDQELLLRNEYLVTENRILHLKSGQWPAWSCITCCFSFTLRNSVSLRGIGCHPDENRRA